MGDANADTSAPLIAGSFARSGRSRRLASFGRAATSRFLRYALSQSETSPSDPPVAVRDTAAEHLEQRRAQWSISKPAITFSALWNVGLAVAALLFLWRSRDEVPTQPIRVWMLGYAVTRTVQVFIFVLEYQRRHRIASEGENAAGELEGTSCFVKQLDSVKSMFSLVWVILGFYWIYRGGQSLAHSAPQLYRSTLFFLGLELFFLVFAVAMACLISICVCCCLPCILVFLQALINEEEGASEEDIQRLPKFKFNVTAAGDSLVTGYATPVAGIMRQMDANPPVEHILQPEDAECCICLCRYEDGAELRELPCYHHFHAACVDRWLHINAICPLCKSSIRAGDQV